MKLGSIILAFALLAVAAALSPYTEEAESAVAALMQQGKDSNACEDLAKASIKEVNDAIKQSQKISDDMDDGAGCLNEGQDAVKAAQKAESERKAELTKALKTENSVCTAPVTLQPQPLSTLDGKSCAFVKNDAGFKAATSKCKNATQAATQAKGAVSAATSAIEGAKKAAEAAKKTCLCKAKKAYSKTLEVFKKMNSKASAKVWSKAHNMLCVLKEDKSCTFKKVPTVTPKPLSDACKNIVCKPVVVKKDVKKDAKKTVKTVAKKTIVHASCKKEHTNLNNCVGDFSDGKGHVRVFVPATKTDKLGECRYKKCGTNNWIKWSGGKITYDSKNGRAMCAAWGRNNENYVFEITMNGKIYRSSEANAKQNGKNPVKCV